MRENVWEKLEELKPTLSTLGALLDDKNLEESSVVLQYGLEVAAGLDNPVEFIKADESHYFGLVKSGTVLTWERFDTEPRWRIYQPLNEKAGE